MCSKSAFDRNLNVGARALLTAVAGLMFVVMPGTAVAQESCGGLQGLQCSDGAYCEYTPEAQCGAADQTGVCHGRGSRHAAAASNRSR